MNGIWIVGDVHGCYKELEKLLQIIPSNDKICFVGDLIDRGKYSKEVVELVVNKYDWVIGNHEAMAITEARYWSQNGRESTVRSFGKDYDRLIELIKNNLHFYHYYENFKKPLLVTHSYGSLEFQYYLKHGYSKCFDKTSWQSYSEENPILWGRPFLKTLENEYNFFNIFGHTSLQKAFINDNVAMIDTGCVYGYKLTALHYPSMEIIQIESQEEKTKIFLDMEEFDKIMMMRLAMMF
jgi:serine/threonine protein phosphatase 1